MSKSYPKSLSELMSASNTRLGRLAEEAKRSVDLFEHIRSGLPADLSPQLISCALDDDSTLVIRTSSPEWAARLRFENALLLSLCRERHPETRAVRIRVSHS
jgi:hypothetical protein